MNRTLSKRQQQILDYIRKEIDEKGYPPTVREICDSVGLSSSSTVHGHLENLEKNGYIRRDSTKPRCIEIVEKENNKHIIVQASKDNIALGILKGDHILLKNVSPKKDDIIAVRINDKISFRKYTRSAKNILGVVEGVFRKL
ncbi:winged helix-turn-helix transcriptional regulator [Crassaminicella thermophila]|uniref:Winged helix-turn-helix transcriptional regulator n=1 Tax=Crassaminicella thermophila TaxID=2599308 RepID=A0A5C0SDR9_CRATE|nr:winged helix-turn-helix transcriptional regulator [Crassaminicella thermophila]